METNTRRASGNAHDRRKARRAAAREIARLKRKLERLLRHAGWTQRYGADIAGSASLRVPE
jgi:hypothetical protein